VTFNPHPRRVLNPNSNVPSLTSLGHRLKLIKAIGVDFFLVIKFTKLFSGIKAEDFVKKILVNKLAIKNLVVGENFLFGHRQSGDLRFLKRLGERFGFQVFWVRPVRMKGAIISSTRIRNIIQKGRLEEASRMLGRPLTILGTVVKGRHIGRRLGFPTANIDPHHETIPPNGVYAVYVRTDKKPCRKAVLNIGTRPTFCRGKEPVLELHILNFKKYIYGKDIEIIFRQKIRNERRFYCIEALRRQIQKDILRAA
jgi:riboflavin kinase/FMN adenylyltransferase